MPDLVIGIPVRCEPSRLKATLAALAAGSGAQSQVVLLPDGADADTRSALGEVSHLLQLPSESPMGTAACFNRLVRSVQAEFYVLLESGAIPAADWLHHLLAACRRYPNCGITGPSTNRGSNQQCIAAAGGDSEAEIAAAARAAARRYGTACRTLEPLYTLADFCYLVRREVVETIGDADELYAPGPGWELDFNIRAHRAGHLGLWACAAYVYRPPVAAHDPQGDAGLAAASRRRYQDKFCGLRLRGEKPDYRDHCRGDACSNFAPARLIAIRPAPLPEPIAAPPEAAATPAPIGPEDPLVSCIMPTCNRRHFVPAAIRSFLAQDYLNLELIVVDDGSDPIGDLLPADPRIRYFHLPGKPTIGAKRNFACEQAHGSLIAHWDDDDWYAPTRIRRQVLALTQSDARICGTSVMYYLDESRDRAFRYAIGNGAGNWMAALLYTHSAWRQNHFEDIRLAEDVKFLARFPLHDRLDLRDHTLTVGAIHNSNTSPKITTGAFWKAESPDTVRAMLRAESMDPLLAMRNSSSAPRALVTAGSGIGDILRVTPLIRVLAGLGHTVDVLLEPDYAEAVQLLEGHPEVGDVFYRTSPYSGIRRERLEGLDSRRYQCATFTTWSAPWQARVTSARKLVFDRAEWLRHGDAHCVEKMAHQLGWTGALPRPLAAASNRRFDLAQGTIALHPGCKPGWPWKKWHGFDELAALFEEVVLIGTPSDLQNDRTYFQRPFRWPAHLKNFTGVLSLRDTAALLSQCSALVSNDSGMLHLGAAVGIACFGIFGITSPRREMIRGANLFPITKQLPCEPACREKPWGRSDCEHHLECLKTLTAQEVYEKVKTALPAKAPAIFARKETAAMPKIGLTYHGHVFDSSGYGHAARAYVHALHSAGVELSVADLSQHQRQVRDPLVESLVGRSIDSDFHLFHGIPPVWAREAFRVPNAIAMTVWETDSMPSQWRTALNHALEVWLPCDFNVSTFQHELAKPVFKLPHAMLPAAGASPPASTLPSVAPGDFVFYSIFEWQDRKCPLGQLTAYFRAFPEDGPHVLVLKSNPAAVRAAAQTVEEARRQTRSGARVAVHCEAWSDAELDALHRRGDCYVSLHRGEGWCYPLFEAACRGTPVIATAYSGPLEYLSDSFHQLVPYRLTSVRQPYVYYNHRMRWAEPELAEAAHRMSWVYEHREEAREKAKAAAPDLQSRYAPEAIGALARDRLADLIRRRSRSRSVGHTETARRKPDPPPLPIPGEWYDADYFEHGIKSNWEDGYSWACFQGLFRDTAAYLTTMFPEASSFLDAGCGKGFLVQALREKGREAWGFDASPWGVDHAVEGARRYMKRADAATVEWDRRFDLTIAWDLLSHLTEDQALQFLTRARRWTSVGLLATIETQEDNAPRRGGGDLSHITLRSARWWHERFTQAGWRRDALHAMLENACQNHPLPSKMGWKLFLYSPD